MPSCWYFAGDCFCPAEVELSTHGYYGHHMDMETEIIDRLYDCL